VKIEFHGIKFMEMEMNSWKIYKFVEFCSDSLGFNEKNPKIINILSLCQIDYIFQVGSMARTSKII